MKPIPTGRLTRTADGIYDLTLTRTFKASADDVWASVTEPERTARWFGPWRGQAAPGRTIEVQMGFEEGTPWCDLRIDTCRPPHHLAVSMTDEAGDWIMELNLVEVDDTTSLELVQHLTDPTVAGQTGPGWEYYLDLLVASRDGSAQPEFEDYYPAQEQHFLRQANSDG